MCTANVVMALLRLENRVGERGDMGPVTWLVSGRAGFEAGSSDFRSSQLTMATLTSLVIL